MLQSIVQKLGQVSFPVHTGERVYMQAFNRKDGLPPELRRWQKTVDQMLEGVPVMDTPIYLMVDQGLVRAGNTQRRAGLHIDGYWLSDKNRHGGVGGRHDLDISDAPEAVLLASNISACRAVVGAFEGIPMEGGDCSHLDVSGLSEVILQPNTCYAGNVAMLHESLPVQMDSLRTLVRLNVPGWSPS